MGLAPLCAILAFNENITLGMVQLIIDASPESLFREGKGGNVLHQLSCNKDMNEEVGLEILNYFIERCPEAVRHVNKFGYLPIHIAVESKSPEF